METVINILEILPIITSAMLLRYATVRKLFWNKKISTQLSGYDLNSFDHDHIVRIVEDIYVSLSFIGEAVLISIGVILFMTKIFANAHGIFGYPLIIICSISIALILVYAILVLKLFRMKRLLLDSPMPRPIFTNSTYKEAYELLLYIGYYITFWIVVYYLCISFAH